MLIFWILTSAIVVGQLIKLPLYSGGVSTLDLTVSFLGLYGLIKLKFQLSKPNFYIKAALFFTFIALISLFLSPLRLTTQEFLTSFLYIIRFTIYILFAWLIYSKAFPDFKNQIMDVLFFSGICLALLGLGQFIFFPDLKPITEYGWDPHFFRTVSSFLDPNFAGAYFALTLILFMYRKDLPFKWHSAIFAMIFIALLTTFSRSSYLLFLVSGLGAAFYLKSRQILLKTLVLFIVLILGFQIYTRLIAEPRNIERGESAAHRLNTWQQGLTIFQASPILGIGFNNYRFALRDYQLADTQFLSSHGSSSNDSSILFVAATTGIIGLIGYIIFLFGLLKINPILLGLLVHSIFANSLFFPPILLWILLSTTVISENPRK